MVDVAERVPADKVDLIHVMNEYGLFRGLDESFYRVLKGYGKPIVTTMHATGNFFIDSIVARYSDRVIVHNRFCLRNFIDKERCVVIPHGCKLVRCPPTEECKRSLGIDPRIPVVGYVGFISQYKGLETLIKAMTKVKNAALLIGGGWFTDEDTGYINSLKEWTLRDLKGRCLWLGYVEEERLPTVYGSMDVVVYPSRFVSESGALLMALSHGKAVIARALPPVEEKGDALWTFSDVEPIQIPSGSSTNSALLTPLSTTV